MTDRDRPPRRFTAYQIAHANTFGDWGGDGAFGLPCPGSYWDPRLPSNRARHRLSPDEDYSRRWAEHWPNCNMCWEQYRRTTGDPLARLAEFALLRDPDGDPDKPLGPDVDFQWLPDGWTPDGPPPTDADPDRPIPGSDFRWIRGNPPKKGKRQRRGPRRNRAADRAVLIDPGHHARTSTQKEKCDDQGPE